MKHIQFNSNLRANQTQTGRSMIEMLGVLAIMAVITVLSIMAYTMAMRNVKVNQIKNDINAMYVDIEGKYFNDYSRVGRLPSNPNLAVQRAFAVSNFDRLFVTTGLFKDHSAPFKGNYGIFGEMAGYTFPYEITIYDLSLKDCLLLKNQDWDRFAIYPGSCTPAQNNSIHFYPNYPTN